MSARRLVPPLCAAIALLTAAAAAADIPPDSGGPYVPRRRHDLEPVPIADPTPADDPIIAPEPSPPPSEAPEPPAPSDPPVAAPASDTPPVVQPSESANKGGCSIGQEPIAPLYFLSAYAFFLLGPRSRRRAG